MYLPDPILTCIRRLNALGYSAWAVGGCVRDALLGLQPHDYDLCTNARPDELRRVFSDYPLVLAGEKHGTVGVVLENQTVEITTYRTEGDYSDSRHPGWVRFEDSLSADLSRRDFTVNAMAYHPEQGYADPFGGKQDLQRRVLRAVGDPQARFSEDALRILRGVRFCVSYGLEPEASTLEAMFALAPRLDTLARERVFEELCKLLCKIHAQELLRFAPILTQVIPELGPTRGFSQHNPHHIHDVFTHTAHVVEAAPPVLALRWAALLHDIGKPRCFTLDDRGCGHFYGHAGISAELAEQILRRLKASNELRTQVVTLVAQHMTYIEPERKPLRRALSRLGAPTLEALLQLQAADTGSKASAGADPYFLQIHGLLEQLKAEEACLHIRDLAINGHHLKALGFQGRQIGDALSRLLEMVLEEAVANEPEALLAAARGFQDSKEELL